MRYIVDTNIAIAMLSQRQPVSPIARGRCLTHLDFGAVWRHALGVSPRTRPPAKPDPGQTSSPEDLDDLMRAGVEAAERGEGIDLTNEEAQHYYETGELPERVQRAGKCWAESWRASRG